MIDTYFNLILISVNSLFKPIRNISDISQETITVYILPLCFFILMSLEWHFPRNKWPLKKLVQSYHTNMSLFLFNNAVFSLFSISALFALAEQYSDYGILDQVTNYGWKIVISIVLLDLMAYLWHLACHKLDCLWMFHKVHHSDPYLNVSTAFRLHIIDLLMFAIVKLAFIILVGIDKSTVLASEIITTLFTMFHHTNIGFSNETEARMGRLIIVPSLHRIHHSVERIEHDQNLGAVLSIWDRLFGTLTEGEPAAIGIKNNGSLGFIDQLKLGFAINPSPGDTTSISEASLQSMIAIAAYYKAQQRQFSPGNETEDWLEAEAEIKESLVCS